MAEKKCTKCGQVLPLDRFYKSGQRGYQSACKSCNAAYTRSRHAADPEKYNAWHRDYRARNREKLSEYCRKVRRENPLKAREYNVTWRKKDPVRALLSAARARAKKYGTECTIDRADIVMPPCCPVLGIPFGKNHGRGRGAHWDSPSLDRIDNSKGYVPGNVQVMSRKANVMKSNATDDELIAFAHWVRRKFS